jgi:polysaccharide chain length determinant protein (PEP-CTERM system associated)
VESAGRRNNGFEVALEVLRRRKWLAILTLGGVFAAAVSIVMFLPNVYRAKATLIIDRQEILEEFVKSTVTSAVETRLQTISQEVLSRSRLESLINRFGLYTYLRERVPLEVVVERMRKDIQLERVGRDQATVAFAISFSGSDPENVALVTNTLASFYIEENSKVREWQAVGTAHFLRVQLEEMKKRLDDQEQQVSEFKERYLGELPQQQEANLATLDRLNMQLRLNGENQLRISERRAALDKQLVEAAGYASIGGSDATVGQTNQRLAQMTQRLADLRMRFTDQHPDVGRVKSEIAALRAQLRSAKSDRGSGQETTRPSPYVLQLMQALSEAGTEIKVLKAEAENLKHSIVIYQQRVENTPQREQEFQALSRDYQATQEIYGSLQRRQEEAQLAESMEQRQKGEQIRILEPAIASQQPAAPNRIRLIFMGLLLSLGLAAGTVVLAEQLDTSFHKLDDLRAFSLVPVLVSIPSIITEADTQWRRWRFGFAAGCAMFGLVLIVTSSYLVATGNEQLVRLFLTK